MTIAARISSGSDDSESLNAAAAPWKSPCRPGGASSSAIARFTASTALPSDSLRARLNDSVTAGNCPWCAIDSEPVTLS